MISTDVLWGYLMMTFPLHNKQNGRACPLTVLLLLLSQWYSIVLVQLHLFWQSTLYSIYKLNENKWYTILDKGKLKQNAIAKLKWKFKTKQKNRSFVLCKFLVAVGSVFFATRLMVQIVNLVAEDWSFCLCVVVLMYGVFLLENFRASKGNNNINIILCWNLYLEVSWYSEKHIWLRIKRS